MGEMWLELDRARSDGRLEVFVWNEEPIRKEGCVVFGPFTVDELHLIAEAILDDEFEKPTGFLSEIAEIVDRWRGEDY